MPFYVTYISLSFDQNNKDKKKVLHLTKHLSIEREQRL